MRENDVDPQPYDGTLHLRVGAIVAYECLLDEAAGTTSWRVGAVRALPTPAPCTSLADHDDSRLDVVKDGLYVAEGGEVQADDEDCVMTSAQPTPSPQDDAPQKEEQKAYCAHIGKARCQTVLIQPWISLAATPVADDVERKAVHAGTGPAAAAAAAAAVAVAVAGSEGKGTAALSSPRALPPAVTPAARFAEIDAMQKELEEIQRFTRDDSRADQERNDDDALGEDEEDRLAKTLTQAYTRVLASAANMEGSEVQHDVDGVRSTSPSLREATDVDPELTRQIEEKRREFRQRIEHILAEMKQTRRQQRDLQTAQANAQASLQNARLQLKEAQEQVQKIDIRALREIQGYRLPPAVVKLVMSAVLCVLGEKASTWQEVVTAMRTPSFISRVALFDPAQLTQSRIQELKKNFISNPHFSHEDALKGSQALGQFHEWIMRQVQLTDADGDLAKFLTQKEASTAGLAATRQKMEADAAELKYLEEELDSLLHERVRRQVKHEEQWKSRSVSRAEASPTATTTEATTSAAKTAPPPPSQQQQQQPYSLPTFKPTTDTLDAFSKQQQQQQQQQSAPGTPRSRAGQASVGSAENGPSAGPLKPTSARLRAAAAAALSQLTITGESSYGISAAAMDSTATPTRFSSTVAQQQQVLALLPPGSQWVCPPNGTVHSTFVLRSSIVCVLSYEADMEENTEGNSETHDSSTAAPQAGRMIALSKPQQDFVCAALRQPLNARPPMPLTEEEAAVEAARQSTATTHHTKSFDGEEWEMVVEDSPEELRQAIIEDIAAICQVPNRAVTNVEWVLGSLHVRCDVSHSGSMTSTALQQAVEDGSYPSVDALYNNRQRVRDSLDEDTTRQMQQASRLALMEDEIQAAQQAEADVRRELEQVRENLERQQHELAEQLAVAQTSSQVDFLDEAREHLALREAMQEVQSALKDRDAQLARLQARLQSAQQDATRDAEAHLAAEQKHAQALADLKKQLAEAKAALEAAATVSQSASDAAAARLADAEDRAKAAEAKADTAQQHVEAQKVAHEEAFHELQSSAKKEAEQHAAAEAARQSTATTHHTKSFDGEEWEMVVEDTPEELRQAIIEDIAAICQVPNRAVTNVEWVLGSLHVRCDVSHSGSMTSTALQQAVEVGSYPSVDALYDNRQQRREKLQSDAEASVQRQQRMEDVAAQLREALAAQASLQHTVQAMERTHIAATERTQQEQQQALENARHTAEQTAADLTRQLDAARAALSEQAEAQMQAATLTSNHDALQQKLAEVEKELADTQQKLCVTNDVLKKLEAQSRRDAKEAEKKAAAALKAAHQQRATEAKAMEKATAELERKLRAAQAALQEQGKLHHKEVVKLLGQVAESEKRQQQLRDEHTPAQAAELQRGAAAQRNATRQTELALAQDRLTEAEARLVEAMQAQLRVMEDACASSAAAQQQQRDAAASDARRREERRAAVENICGKARDLAQRMTDTSASPSMNAGAACTTPNQQQQQQQFHEAKVALGRELAAQLNAMRKDKEDASAAVAQSRRAAEGLQHDMNQAKQTTEQRQGAKAEELVRLRALQEAADGGAASGEAPDERTAISGNEEKADALAKLRSKIKKATKRFSAATQDLSATEEERLKACATEETEVARLLHGMDASSSSTSSGGDGGVFAQCMREVHQLATTSFLQRHQTVWMNTCLCGLLFTAVATLQYKKYAV